MTRTSRRTRLATAAVLAPLALGLVACGGDDDADDASAPTTSATSEATSETTETPGTDESSAPTDDSDDTAATGGGDVETAARTALGEVDGTVFSVERDDRGWDVTIVTADGVENDLELSADATTVTRGPVADTDDDADDVAERELLLGASLDHLAAMAAALAEVPGTVTGVELSEDDGAAVWEVELDEDTPDETTVDVDAETGAVLRVERDD